MVMSIVERRQLLQSVLLTYGFATALKVVGFRIRNRRILAALVVGRAVHRVYSTDTYKRRKAASDSYYSNNVFLGNVGNTDLRWLHEALLALSFVVGLDAFPGLSFNPDAMELD